MTFIRATHRMGGVTATHPSDSRVRKENMMVTPKVNETKRGSAHKPPSGASAPASVQPPQR
jgi:hypothetical protein